MDSALRILCTSFNEYHILALDVGYGGTKANKERLISKMEEYMEYTFSQTKTGKAIPLLLSFTILILVRLIFLVGQV